MTNLIVAFPKPEDAKNIRNILVKNGFSVVAVCTSGAQALQYADDLHNGVIVCGYRLTDMLYSQLRENLSPQFGLLLLASMRYISEIDDDTVTCVAMPIKVHELVTSVRSAINACEVRRRKSRQQPKVRNVLDKQQITQAKQLLMERKNMTEEEAHRYLQKSSMDNGVNMIETAQMIISVMGGAKS